MPAHILKMHRHLHRGDDASLSTCGMSKCFSTFKYDGPHQTAYNLLVTNRQSFDSL